MNPEIFKDIYVVVPSSYEIAFRSISDSPISLCGIYLSLFLLAPERAEAAQKFVEFHPLNTIPPFDIQARDK